MLLHWELDELESRHEQGYSLDAGKFFGSFVIIQR